MFVSAAHFSFFTKTFLVLRPSGTNWPPQRNRFVSAGELSFLLAVDRWGVRQSQGHPEWPFPWRSVHRTVTGKGHPLLPTLNLPSYDFAHVHFSLPLQALCSSSHPGLTHIVQLDLDLKYRVNIRELFQEFHRFPPRAVIGIAREMQPVYRWEPVCNQSAAAL